jgi:phospholipid transport system substrate-binding protein
MQIKFRRIPVVLVFVFGLLSGLGIAGVAHADEQAAGAKVFIENLADRAVKSLAAPDIDTAERRKRFRVVMLENFAFDRIAKWVLGRYWRRASDAEKAEYLKLYEDMLVLVYADRFAKYSGEVLQVGRSEVRGKNDILVYSKIVRPEGLKPVDVAWRISQQESEYKIIDVMVEGLSMGLTQQKEFASVIRQNGGSVQGLIDELKKRLAANS